VSFTRQCLYLTLLKEKGGGGYRAGRYCRESIVWWGGND